MCKVWPFAWKGFWRRTKRSSELWFPLGRLKSSCDASGDAEWCRLCVLWRGNASWTEPRTPNLPLPAPRASPVNITSVMWCLEVVSRLKAASWQIFTALVLVLSGDWDQDTHLQGKVPAFGAVVQACLILQQVYHLVLCLISSCWNTFLP